MNAWHLDAASAVGVAAMGHPAPPCLIYVTATAHRCALVGTQNNLFCLDHMLSVLVAWCADCHGCSSPQQCHGVAADGQGSRGCHLGARHGAALTRSAWRVRATVQLRGNYNKPLQQFGNRWV